MRKTTLTLFSFLVFCARGQDTFSILAFDTVTREVGAAGASCVDLFQTPYTNDFIAELFPDTGAIMSQSYYVPQNQVNARARMRAGDTPSQIMTWLQANDVQTNAAVRQYGALRFGSPSAAFTGSNCLDYKNHITGPNYTIQGNILLGKQVLDSMEARFLREEGNLGCKLMAAMQGAKMQGADSRCHNNNSSSLFAFLKVTQPWESFGDPSLLIGLRTHSGDSIEPIDSLQKLFDLFQVCEPDDTGLPSLEGKSALSVHPNPAAGEVLVSFENGISAILKLTDLQGRIFLERRITGKLRLDVRDWARGLYIVEIETAGARFRKKLILD